MNPLFFQTITSIILRPKQRCPSCNREQPTSPTEKTICIACGATIPPASPQSR